MMSTDAASNGKEGDGLREEDKPWNYHRFYNARHPRRRPPGNTNDPTGQSAKSPSLEVVVDGGQQVDQVRNGAVQSDGEKKRQPSGGGWKAAQERNIFCQMDVLYHFEDGDMEWREAARWIKYEERVEVGKRWSKPYVATVSLHALFELRRCISDGVVILDLSENNLIDIATALGEELSEDLGLTTEDKKKLMYVLMRPHKHQHIKGLNKLPFQGKLGYWKQGNKEEGQAGSPDSNKDVKVTFETNFPFPELPEDGTAHPTPVQSKQNKRFKKKLPKGSEAANLLVGEVDFLSHPVMVFIRLEHGAELEGVTEVHLPSKFIFLLLGPPEHHSIWEYEEVGRAAATLLTDKVFCEVAHQARDRKDLLDGVDEFIDDLTVLPPNIWDPSTRLEPPTSTNDNAALRARRKLASRERHFTLPDISDDEGDDEEDEILESKEDPTLQRSGRLFGGLFQDIKRRYPKYWSDIKDGLALQSIATIFFLYFACITPIVTFGGVLGLATDGYMGTMECIVAGAVCGLIYHLFSGQPLTIVGATGPLLVFESILYRLCADNDWEFMAFRFWIGIWVMVILLVCVALDLSSLVRYVTRFTEESFAVLISLIFIYEAFSNVIHILDYYPIQLHQETYMESDTNCHCIPSPCFDINATDCIGLLDVSNSSVGWLSVVHRDCINIDEDIRISHYCLTEKDCIKYGGNLTGSECHNNSVTNAVPDVFLFSCFLFLCTFGIAITLNLWFRNSSYLPGILRTTIADFAVVIGIAITTGLDLLFDLPTPKLEVPDKFQTTLEGRGWIVNPMELGSKWWLALLALVPAILATILIFLDQQITTVIVNRKEHKLKKGHGYHLDLFVLSISIGLCSLFGLPWFVAATVRTITHVRSLMLQSETNAPGEVPQFLGVREQRVTGVTIHFLIACSIVLTGVLKHIPMPVLYGVFLYMGVSSLRGVQFIQRVCIVFMPHKYQPDYVYLRHVNTSRVYIFTLIQVLCMASMWVVKQIKSISIAFPLMILGLCAVRKIMGYIFKAHELEWLDDLSPEEYRRHKEDKQLKDGVKGEHLTDYDLDKIEYGKEDEDTRLQEEIKAVHSHKNLRSLGSSHKLDNGSTENIVTQTIPHTSTWKNLGDELAAPDDYKQTDAVRKRRRSIQVGLSSKALEHIDDEDNGLTMTIRETSEERKEQDSPTRL